MPVIDELKSRIVGTTTGLFAHAPYPLEESLEYAGDPGLFGPGSITWSASSPAPTRASSAGVADHSRYRDDPLGRLSRTSAYVTATAFGAMPEVEHAVNLVRQAHRPVRGKSHRDRAYSANHPAQAAWVHNVLTESFLATHLLFGKRKLTPAEADEFVLEQTEVGKLLGSDPLPETAAELKSWVVDHPDIGTSPGMHGAIDFLKSPPLPLKVKIGYWILYQAAAATIPRKIRTLLGIRRYPGAILAGKALTRFLRWALGSSPSWYIALTRVGAPLPADHRFRTKPFE